MFHSPASPSQESVKRLLGTKRDLRWLEWWGGQGSGVVTSVRRRLFEGKDEPVSTGGDGGSVEECRVPSRPVDQDYTHLYKHL